MSETVTNRANTEYKDQDRWTILSEPHGIRAGLSYRSNSTSDSSKEVVITGLPDPKVSKDTRLVDWLDKLDNDKTLGYLGKNTAKAEVIRFWRDRTYIPTLMAW
ncbi:hypothetical protein V866_005283 [Kwoniella sp. B9012]|uniref:Uncharacterized protein n=1 Tax=Kwoniella europaea PYCC6329 TaxID=1423913 RepID=A0AAX4KMB9_9TREE